MLDMIRQSQVPANIVRSAAKGSLDIPPMEKIEVLVYLTSHPLFGKEAQMTLAGWDPKESIAAASDPHTPFEVLDYFIRPENRRPALLPALLENSSVPEARLLDMANESKREIVEIMLASLRVRRSVILLNALALNEQTKVTEKERVRSYLATLAESEGAPGDRVLRQFVHEQASAIARTAGTPLDFTQAGTEAEQDLIVSDFLREHALAISEEEGNPFQLVGGAASVADDIAVPVLEPAMSEDERNLKMRAAEAATRVRLSTLQKLARLTVGERVQAAMKGSKDERAILIRDGSKVVSLAVLSSPKVSASEIETFASLKNVSESILREIARNRKFLKNYGVIRNLTNNPRCPLDVSLTLVKNLIMTDLKNLSSNKNLPDTLRKVATKHFKERSGPPH